MTLTITEAWIRDRVQLTHDNLEDVRSLSLPGTYQEKIGGLGNALSSFTRLKHIDLSRNALQSLQGLHHLKALEKLNLYYNNISSIQELKRLRHNTSLQEIDLRLNPVTKNEPDYRLYLVHMLPNLRKLDDRSVRESERKTALLHFDTDQAMSMTEHTAPQGLEPLRGELPRTKHVRGLGGRTAIEEDDSDLLDLLSRTNGDLSRPRPVTGSNVTNPSVDVQLTQDYQRGYSQRTPPRRKAESSPSSRGVERDRSLYQSDTETVLPELTVDSLLPLNTSAASDSTGSLLGADPLDQLNDSNLSTGLSPLRLPDAPLSHADPLTLHDDLSSQTDTNSVMDDLTKYSDLWQPSHSLLEERKAFEQEHKDLLSPTDTNSLINGDVAKLGKGRLSFSPVEERRKLDFDTFSEDSSFIGPDKETTSSSSSFSRSTVSQSQKEHVSQNSLSSATPRGSSLIKAGDIYTSIMSQTRISRARTRGRSRSASPDNSPLSVAASTGSRLTSPSRSPEPSQHLSDRERSQQQQQRSKVEVSHPEQEVRGRVDSNLKFTDESDAYAAYSSKVNFTPNPKAGTRTDSSSSYDLHPVSGVGETFDDPPPVQRNVKQNGTTSAPAMSTSTFLDSLLNLVDRYWNGTKSLHAHSKFQGQALPLVEKLLADHSATSQEHMDRLQLDVARYAQENVSLRNKLGSTAGAKTQQDTQMAGSELQRALDKSQRDVDRLCLELREVSDENRELQVQLQNARRHTDDGPSQRDVKGQEKLEQENEKLKVQLKHVSQLQELATMLQESHKSLVTTNDHLLKELEETKQRHMEEVKQLHWSYNQLKQTMDITMPSSHAPPQSTTTATTQGGAVNGYDKKEDGSLSMQPGYGSYSPGKKVKGFSYSNGSMYD
ncbi:centrosomal protein of 72 kDa-like isoform X2 [Lytechinus variegatus]|uniref:centrosomal protein of 72 kDa-like isoform X2 n=1 Tax=Lytechinus variegatus TaxID=7654 RepID=UPI001BB2487B|nr:centrosomal protein of 72 kDa-like isoform X2 [Lytechinus variegatus]